MINLIIDARENAIREKKQDWIYNQLDNGDFQIHQDEKIKIIIERKTVSDLEASIKDNRHREQKLRALEYCKSINAEYCLLIEGFQQFSFRDASQRQKMLSSCIINTLFRDDIKIIFTKNIDETIKFLEYLVYKISENPNTYFSNKDDNQLMYQDALIKQKKKDNTNNNVLIMQLCAIPGISVKKAQTILTIHNDVKNIHQLCAKMAKNTSKNFFKDVNGIGKKLQTSIYSFCGIDTQGNESIS